MAATNDFTMGGGAKTNKQKMTSMETRRVLFILKKIKEGEHISASVYSCKTLFYVHFTMGKFGSSK